ncbi:MAG: hypothetical protein U1U88_001089 [Lawsonella clevelandensis]
MGIVGLRSPSPPLTPSSLTGCGVSSPSTCAGIALLRSLQSAAVNGSTPRVRSWIYGIFLLVSAAGSMVMGLLSVPRWRARWCPKNVARIWKPRWSSGRSAAAPHGPPPPERRQLPTRTCRTTTHSPLMAVLAPAGRVVGTHWTTTPVSTPPWWPAPCCWSRGCWRAAPASPKAFLVLVAVPPVTMNVVAAGLDLVVVALLLLCVVAAFRGTSALAALAGVVVLGMKMTALPGRLMVAISLGYRSWKSW